MSRFMHDLPGTSSELRTVRRLGNAMLPLMLAITFTSGNQALAQSNSPTFVSPPVQPYVLNKDLRTLPRAVPSSDERPRPQLGPAVPTASHYADPLWVSSGSATGLSVMPPEFAVANPNFDGFITGGSPPDTNGAPGPNHYIQTVNGSVFRIYDKTGALLVGTTNFQQLWINAGAPADDDCRVRGRGDPYVVYDHLADRWVLSQLANHLTDAGDPLQVECLAVSQGPNPVTDGWYAYTFLLPFSNDYPKIGLWPDGYYSVTQRGYNGNPVDVTVYDRANMLNGNPATFQTRSVAGPPTIIILPADLSGTPPEPGTPNFYARPVDGNLFGGVDRIEIFEFHVDWGVPANTTFTLVQTLNPSGFASDICDGANLFNNCIDQPANPARKEALSVWPMGPLQYRNFLGYETLVFNHTVDVNGAGLAGVRWYELRRSSGLWSLHQEGTFSPPDGENIHRWMGSIAMDKMGNMALGYSVSNDGVASTVHPGIRYAGRLASDPHGLLPFGEVTLVAGGGSTGGTRWGDYSAMRVDPVDDCTFWYTTQYIAAGPSQRTRIGAFRFPTCNATDLSITKIDSPDPVTAGSQLNYTIHVTNGGPSNATQVVVLDTLPASVAFISSSIPCPLDTLITRACTIGNLASGASTSFTIQVRVLSNTPPGSITNTATVSGHELDPDASDNTATATTEVIAVADVAISKECKPDQPNKAPAGTTTFCEIYVDNFGPSDAQNVVITDRIISNTPFTVTAVISTNTGAGVPASCPPTPIGPTMDTTIVCTDAVLPAGARDTIRVEFTANNTGDINDTATVTSSTPDSNTSNNVAVGRVSFGAASDLSVSKTAPATVVAGTTMTYRINLANLGPSIAANVVVHDALPAGVAFQSATPSPGGVCQAGVVPGDPTKPLTCNFGSIPFPGGATVDVLVRVNSDVPTGTVLVNNVDVSSASPDPFNNNNIDTVTTRVETSADLVVFKSSDASVYKPSSLVTYSINVVNNGPSKALNVVVTDTLPDLKAALYQSDTGGCVLSAPKTLKCNLGDMAVGDNRTFFVYAVIKGNKGPVDNTASVGSASVPPTPDPVPANNSSTRTVIIGK